MFFTIGCCGQIIGGATGGTVCSTLGCGGVNFDITCGGTGVDNWFGCSTCGYSISAVPCRSGMKGKSGMAIFSLGGCGVGAFSICCTTGVGVGLYYLINLAIFLNASRSLSPFQWCGILPVDGEGGGINHAASIRDPAFEAMIM
eukprot:15367139-Ditylum_brightwellii.AAC.2